MQPQFTAHTTTPATAVGSTPTPDYGEFVFSDYPAHCDKCRHEIPAKATFILFRSRNKRACMDCATGAPATVEVAA